MTTLARHIALGLIGGWMWGMAQAGTTTVPADLNAWTCTGQCGTLSANGDITTSPLGNGSYGLVTTAGSTAHGVSPLQLTESGGKGLDFTATNGSRWESPSFSVASGDTVSAWFNYVSTDGKGYDDYAWARLVPQTGAAEAIWLFTARSTHSNKQSIVPGDLEVGFDPDAVIVNYDDFDFQVRNLETPTPIQWAPLGDDNGLCWRNDAPGCGFTGWLQSKVTVNQAGLYRLEVGVVNFGDELYASGLAFDVPGLTPIATAVPEPSAWLLTLAGLGALAVARPGRARTPSR